MINKKQSRKERQAKSREMLVINYFLDRVIKGLPKKDSKQFILLINKFYALPKKPKFVFVYDIFHPKTKKEKK
jgi:ATP adenylyltransferase/5',5'''-P-1,P-4-tetraphosphate phosphorylase II